MSMSREKKTLSRSIRKRRVAQMRGYPQWRWHLDDVFVKVNGKLCYLWRAVDHEGEVLEAVVTAKRDKAAALKLLKRIMKRYGRPSGKIRISRFDDESERCSGFEVRRRCGISAQFTFKSTTISIRSAIW
jgi:transposase-like protein